MSSYFDKHHRHWLSSSLPLRLIQAMSASVRQSHRYTKRPIIDRTIMESTQPPSFTIFPNLPAELQLAIWACAAADPVKTPEVCIAWPLNIDAINGDTPATPFLIDTAWPAISHTCRASRAIALSNSESSKSNLIRYRPSRVAGFPVPFRVFDPAIDTLYWTRHNKGCVLKFLKDHENAEFTRSLRHIAMPAVATYPPTNLSVLIQRHAMFLKSLSIVLPDTSGQAHSTMSFLPPARWCRLQDIPEDVASGLILKGIPFPRSHHAPLPGYLAQLRRDLDGFMGAGARRDTSVLVGDSDSYEVTAWSVEDVAFTGLELKAQTFVEYKLTEDKGQEWVEVCGGRLLDISGAEMPKYLMLEDRGDPQLNRVLDDDNEWRPRSPVSAQVGWAGW